MSTEQAKPTTQNAQLMDVEYSASNAASRVAHERA